MMIVSAPVPVFHPHVVPLLPAPICLTDDFRLDRTDLGMLLRTLAAMLRYEPGTFSLSDDRALALGVARWLRGVGLDHFDLPLAPPSYAPVRVLKEGAAQ